MGRNARHSAQIQAANQARTAAIRRLIEAHREEYEEIYAAEAESRGVSARRVRRAPKSKTDRLDEVRRKLRVMSISAPSSLHITHSGTANDDRDEEAAGDATGA